MDKLLQTVSELLNKNTKLETYSSASQYTTDTSRTVFWNQSAASISPDIYQKLKDAVAKRVCNFYEINKKLPYYDFCIVLLCCIDYSANHETLSQVKSRSFKSAWRSISIIAATADKDLQDWINDRIQDRDAAKYCMAMGMSDQESPTVERRISLGKFNARYDTDSSIVSRACSSKNIKEVGVDSSMTTSVLLNRITSTPEGQLDNLRIIHKEFLLQ